MHAKNRLFKGFVIVLIALIVLGGGLLVLKNLNLSQANEALDNNAPVTYSEDEMSIGMTTKTIETPEDGADEAAE